MERQRFRRTIIFGAFILFFIVQMGLELRKPEFLKPFVGVFGANPLGIPTVVAAGATMLAILLPIFAKVWHVIGLTDAIRQRQGKAPLGVYSIGSAAWRNRFDPLVYHYGRAVLIDLAAFIGVTTLWIIATAIAGV